MSWQRIAEDPLCALAEAISTKKEKHKEKRKTKQEQDAAADTERAAAAQPETRNEQSHKAASQASEPLAKRTGEATRSDTPEQRVIEGDRLFAISDLHLAYRANLDFWSRLEPHPNDGLILAGDVGETDEHLELAFSTAVRCFKQVWWTVGNHELYSVSRNAATGSALKNVPRGEKKYEACVEVARRYGVLTPEDDFVTWSNSTGKAIIAPIFTLYDYSFAPDGVPTEKAVAWAEEEDVMATDEALLHPDPYPTKQAWCASLVSRFEQKLELTVQQNPGVPLVIINHWPLRLDTVKFFKYHRFIIWCGTRKTEDWHVRFNASVVVTGHIHLRRTDWRESTRFEEVSMGYPREWKDAADSGREINTLLREILPGPARPATFPVPTVFRRYG